MNSINRYDICLQTNVNVFVCLCCFCTYWICVSDSILFFIRFVLEIRFFFFLSTLVFSPHIFFCSFFKILLNVIHTHIRKLTQIPTMNMNRNKTHTHTRTHVCISKIQFFVCLLTTSYFHHLLYKLRNRTIHEA